MANAQKPVPFYAGYEDFKNEAWKRFIKKFPAHAKKLRSLEGDPYPMTLVAWGFDPEALSAPGPTSNLSQALLTGIRKAPDATFALLNYVRLEARKATRLKRGRAEFFLRGTKRRQMLEDFQKLDHKPTLGEIAGIVGVSEKAIRNAGEKIRRQRMPRKKT